MRPRSSRRKLALGIGASTLAIVTSAALVLHEPLWYRYLATRAADSLASEGFDPQQPGEHFETILAAGRDGDAALSLLLRDRRYRVWTNTVFLLDQKLSEEARESLIERLRTNDAEALVRYLLIEPYRRSAAWREDFTLDDAPFAKQKPGMEDALRKYWTGEARGKLPSDRRAVRFLESILDRDIDYRSDERYYHRLELRAVSALSAMLPRGWTRQYPDDPALRALTRAAQSHGDPELRFFATTRLLQTHGPSAGVPYLPLATWDRLSLISERSLTSGLHDFEAFFSSITEHEQGARLWPLVHLDHPRAATILTRLAKKTGLRSRVKEARTTRFSEIPIPTITSTADPKTVKLPGIDDSNAMEILGTFHREFVAHFQHGVAVPHEAVSEMVPFQIPWVDDPEDANSSWPNIDNSRFQFTQYWQQRGAEEREHAEAMRLATVGDALLRSGRREILDAHISFLQTHLTKMRLLLYWYGCTGLELPDFVHARDLPSPWREDGNRSESRPDLVLLQSRLANWWHDHRNRLIWNPTKRVWELRDGEPTPN